MCCNCLLSNFSRLIESEKLYSTSQSLELSVLHSCCGLSCWGRCHRSFPSFENSKFLLFCSHTFPQTTAVQQRAMIKTCLIIYSKNSQSSSRTWSCGCLQLPPQRSGNHINSGSAVVCTSLSLFIHFRQSPSLSPLTHTHTHTHTQMTFSFHHPRNPFYYLQVFVAFNFLREISICSYMRSVLLSFSHRDFKAPLISGAFLYPFLKQGEASSSLPTVQPLISAQTNSKFTQLRFRLPIFISSIKLLRGDRVNKART